MRTRGYGDIGSSQSLARWPCSSRAPAVRPLALLGVTPAAGNASCMSGDVPVLRAPGGEIRPGDWVITCTSAAEARTALATATAVLERLGVRINPTKTRIVRVQHGFEFLGYKIKRGKGLRLPLHKVRTRLRPGGLYAYPTQKSLRHFQDQVRSRTRRKAPVSTEVLIEQLNPVLRGWGHYYKRAHVRKLFHQLDGWVVRRVWAHRSKRWRCRGWLSLSNATLYGELGLVNLVGLIPSIGPHHARTSS